MIDNESRAEPPPARTTSGSTVGSTVMPSSCVMCSRCARSAAGGISRNG